MPTCVATDETRRHETVFMAQAMLLATEPRRVRTDGSLSVVCLR